ncbi:MAG: hypothetical protein ACPGUD_05860 [Parashewanella sp.]
MATSSTSVSSSPSSFLPSTKPAIKPIQTDKNSKASTIGKVEQVSGDIAQYAEVKAWSEGVAQLDAVVRAGFSSHVASEGTHLLVELIREEIKRYQSGEAERAALDVLKLFMEVRESLLKPVDKQKLSYVLCVDNKETDAKWYLELRLNGKAIISFNSTQEKSHKQLLTALKIVHAKYEMFLACNGCIKYPQFIGLFKSLTVNDLKPEVVAMRCLELTDAISVQARQMLALELVEKEGNNKLLVKLGGRVLLPVTIGEGENKAGKVAIIRGCQKGLACLQHIPFGRFKFEHFRAAMNQVKGANATFPMALTSWTRLREQTLPESTRLYTIACENDALALNDQQSNLCPLSCQLGLPGGGAASFKINHYALHPKGFKVLSAEYLAFLEARQLPSAIAQRTGKQQQAQQMQDIKKCDNFRAGIAKATDPKKLEQELLALLENLGIASKKGLIAEKYQEVAVQAHKKIAELTEQAAQRKEQQAQAEIKAEQQAQELQKREKLEAVKQQLVSDMQSHLHDGITPKNYGEIIEVVLSDHYPLLERTRALQFLCSCLKSQRDVFSCQLKEATAERDGMLMLYYNKGEVNEQHLATFPISRSEDQDQHKRIKGHVESFQKYQITRGTIQKGWPSKAYENDGTGLFARDYIESELPALMALKRHNDQQELLVEYGFDCIDVTELASESSSQEVQQKKVAALKAFFGEFKRHSHVLGPDELSTFCLSEGKKSLTLLKKVITKADFDDADIIKAMKDCEIVMPINKDKYQSIEFLTSLVVMF